VFLFQYRNIWTKYEYFCFDIETFELNLNISVSIYKFLRRIETFSFRFDPKLRYPNVSAFVLISLNYYSRWPGSSGSTGSTRNTGYERYRHSSTHSRLTTTHGSASPTLTLGTYSRRCDDDTEQDICTCSQSTSSQELHLGSMQEVRLIALLLFLISIRCC
jgi:hypothetical protein